MTGSRWTRPGDIPFPTVWRWYNGKQPLEGKTPRFRIQDVTEDLEDEVVQHMTDVFLRDEPMCSSVGLADDPVSVLEFQTMWRDYMRQRVALVAVVEPETTPYSGHRVAGCNLLGITCRGDVTDINKVLRKIFGAKRDEVTGEWRKLHNIELHAFYSSPDIIRNIKSRRLRWAGQVAHMGESRNAYRMLVGRPEGKRPLGRPRRRWEDNIKMNLREVGYDDREWINFAQDSDQWQAYVREAMHLRYKGVAFRKLIEALDHTTKMAKLFERYGVDYYLCALGLSVAREYRGQGLGFELLNVDGIGDREMTFGEMRQRIRHRLPDIRLTFGENFGKTQSEEQRLRVFENKVLTKIFGAKRDEVTGEWRKLHNAELHALYSSPDIIRNIKSRRLRWAGHVARMGESRNAYRVLVGRPEGKRPLGRPRRRWENNIKMDLREVGYGGRDWINLAQDRDQWRAYVRAAMNLRVP
ncbi:hypothetical protein ANN_20766 [Periplaneta americana]|uniref:N-acetyltransferase domain-containing protein n=1 Tax=Periplaneta americana TaxID=6978 RepID=A0ABQ8SEM5_PERAM|nr:hypothetical protein ANN_20766 [Periplaneta americana]